MLKHLGHRIYFKHNVPENTECHIETDGGDIIGMAWCSQSDQFCRRTGRKVALARAMKEAGWDKATRREVWDKYHETLYWSMMDGIFGHER